MRTRAVREGTVGLLVIFGLGLVTSLIFGCVVLILGVERTPYKLS